jgi:hypothetical protein
VEIKALIGAADVGIMGELGRLLEGEAGYERQRRGWDLGMLDSAVSPGKSGDDMGALRGPLA